MKNVIRRYHGSRADLRPDSPLCGAEDCVRFREKGKNYCTVHQKLHNKRGTRRNPSGSAYISELIKVVDAKLRTGKPLD